jgi:hypothetical protein
MSQTKDVPYLNKTFDDFNKSFEEFIKTYYPNSYNDFTDASVGKIFMDLASMVGDNLSFYQDYQFNETLILNAKERKNIYALAYQLGYKPKVSTPSIVNLTVFQQVPIKYISGIYIPDLDYAISIKNGTIVSSIMQGQNFYIKDLIDFSVSTTDNPRRESIYLTDSITNKPTYMLLEKDVLAISGTIVSKTFAIGSPTKYLTLDLNDDNIIEIVDILDSDGNKYYEVDNLAQDLIFEEIQNTDTRTNISNNETPYILKLTKVPRRFVSRFKRDDLLQIEFGAGISDSPDEEYTLNPNNIGINTFDTLSSLSNSYDITSFLNTKTYGTAPKNTVLTVRYLTGGGLTANVDANTINNISLIDVIKNPYLPQSDINYLINSIGVNNKKPASGGKGIDSIEEIKLNAISNYTTQNRTVTREDYIARVLSMPSRYGSVSKVYVEKNSNNIILYCNGYDKNKNIVNLSLASKQNLKKYLSKYKMLNDAIEIKDSCVINFKCFFDIIVLPTYNSNDVLFNCNKKLIEFFDIDRWQINQPIILSDVFTILSQVIGVQNVSRLEFEDLSGGDYSEFSYDFKSALKNNIIYPSKDLMIFELKNPLINIFGRVINY